MAYIFFFFFQAEDGIRDFHVTGVQTCALPISPARANAARRATGRQTRGQLPPARLGRLAPALLGLSDSDHPLRTLRRRAGTGERPAGHAARGCRFRWTRQSARSASHLEEGGVSE